jgi:TatD DNase family protein
MTSKNGLKIIERIPKSLLLFETDGPFVRNNNKIIQPWDLKRLYQKVDIIIPKFEEIVFNNFKRLLIERDFLKQG